MSTTTAEAFELFKRSIYLAFDKNVTEELLAFLIVDKLSTTALESPITFPLISLASSSNLKLICFDTNQTEKSPQLLQHQA